MSVAAPAAAAPSASEREVARTLMTEGRTRRANHDLQGALESFRRAHAMMNVPTTAIEVAQAELALGHLVAAREVLLAIPPPTAGEPAPFKSARTRADELRASLDARIPTIKVAVAPSDTPATVTLDGTVLSREQWTDLRVDPGAHSLEARSNDMEVQRDLLVGEGESREVVLDLAFRTAVASAATPEVLVSDPSSERASPSPAASSGPASTPDSRPPASGTPRWAHPLFVSGLVGAGAGLATTAAFGALSIVKKNNASDDCIGTRCSPAARDSLDSARTFAAISTVGFIVAGVGAGAAATGFIVEHRLLSPSSQGSSPVSVRVQAVGPGVLVRGTF